MQENIRNLPLRTCCAKWIWLLIFIFCAGPGYNRLDAQIDQHKFRIIFTDKLHTAYSLNNPYQFLSTRAVERRIKHRIVIDSLDLPVNKIYTDSLKNMGCTVYSVSKWFNSVVVTIPEQYIYDKLQAVSFIDTIYSVYGGNLKKSKVQKFVDNTEESPFPGSKEQILIHNGQFLHDQGFTGSNIIIAVLDGGFKNADHMVVFESLFEQNRVVATKDFVNPGGNVYLEHEHGTNVLSIMASNVPGTFIGSAPNASYLLLRSEDTRTEFPVEEHNFVSALEYADSIGADIVTSSLGYYEFDNPDANYEYNDLDGRTTLVTLGSNIAFEKGMVCVTSAGNSGNSAWGYISAPGDAVNTITVGAIDRYDQIASFSSFGPTYDGRVKPDVVAVGQGTAIVRPFDNYTYGNGTSYSCPVIAGLTACLMQAFPNRLNHEIVEAVRISSSRYTDPDYYYGYGITDYKKAYIFLENKPDVDSSGYERISILSSVRNREEIIIMITDKLVSDLNVRVFSTNGTLVCQHKLNDMIPFAPVKLKLGTDSPGVYVIYVEGRNLTVVKKIVKL